MVVDVTLIQPQVFLGEVVVLVDVGGVGLVVATGRDTDAGADLWVDVGIRAQTNTDTLTVLVLAVVLVVDLDRFLAHTNVAFELGLGGPCDFLFKRRQLGRLGGGGGGDLVGCRLLSLLLSLLILGELRLQFGVLGWRDRAVGLEHVEQFRVDCGAGRNAHGQQQTATQGCRSFSGSKTHINLRR